MVRARDVKVLPDDEAFDRALLLGVRGTPNNPCAVEDGDDLPHQEVPRVPRERPAEPVQNPPVRRMIIHKSYLDRFGYTRGCRRCEAIMKGDAASAGQHSEACREHIEKTKWPTRCCVNVLEQLEIDKTGIFRRRSRQARRIRLERMVQR